MSPKPSPSIIEEIIVDDLFGMYSYQLRANRVPSRLLLLYGENGSGKTTISHIVYHLLSRQSRRGHRTFLAQCKFKNISIRFRNGITISAFRTGNSLFGPYMVSGVDQSGCILETYVKVNDQGTVRVGDVDEEDICKILDLCTTPDSQIYLLDDNRFLYGDSLDNEDFERHSSFEFNYSESRSDRSQRFPRRVVDMVSTSIDRAESWLRQQVLRATDSGEASTSTIYLDILRRLASTPSTKSVNEKSEEALLKELDSLSKASVDLNTYGLFQQIPTDLFRSIIASSNDEQREIINRVLEPYVNSMRSRVESLSSIYRKIEIFLRILNRSYYKKSVRFSVLDGITVFDKSDNLLSPEFLSSGEKQLMILLCNVLATSLGHTIFIIDEPELSLNVIWQRNLSASLLALADSDQFQFLIATHSLEILSGHGESIMQLVDRKA